MLNVLCLQTNCAIVLYHGFRGEEDFHQFHNETCVDVGRFNFTSKTYLTVMVNSTNDFGNTSSRHILRYAIDISKLL